MKKRALKISINDNIAVALDNLLAGERVNLYSIESQLIDKLTAAEDITYLHKIAVQKIPVNEAIIKYGEVVGYSCKNVDAGELVHTSNMTSKPQKNPG